MKLGIAGTPLPDYDNMTDEAIVEIARTGDVDAQEYLINKYKKFQDNLHPNYYKFFLNYYNFLLNYYNFLLNLLQLFSQLITIVTLKIE